ncbi:MAG TPA: dTMP kinase [Candidatus Bipolaricaulota bacterium]|nr:dTMP kinase [Candidatus Bipolaricaulota bacterium]
MSGKFIVFEGGEGTGKTTQIKLLEEQLKNAGYQTLLTREPGGTDCPIAEKIRTLLKDPANKEMMPETELFLFCASRAQHVKQIIRPKMDQGTIVICDRFQGSSFAYQHFGRGLFDLNKVKEINGFATGGLNPDLTILLDIDPKIGLARVENGQDRNNLKDDRFDAEKIEFHEKVRQGYLSLAKTEVNWVVIDADDTIENIQNKIWQEIKKILMV